MGRRTSNDAGARRKSRVGDPAPFTLPCAPVRPPQSRTSRRTIDPLEPVTVLERHGGSRRGFPTIDIMEARPSNTPSLLEYVHFTNRPTDKGYKLFMGHTRLVASSFGDERQ